VLTSQKKGEGEGSNLLSGKRGGVRTSRQFRAWEEGKEEKGGEETFFSAFVEDLHVEGWGLKRFSRTRMSACWGREKKKKTMNGGSIQYV